MKSNPQLQSLQRRGVRHRGAAGLMLVLILTLLVGTFSLSLTRRVNDERRSDLHRQTVHHLQAAVDAVKASDFDGEQPIRLPLDRDDQRWIMIEIVETTDSVPVYQATLYHSDQPGLSVTRPMTVGS